MLRLLRMIAGNVERKIVGLVLKPIMNANPFMNAEGVMEIMTSSHEIHMCEFTRDRRC